MDGTPNMDNQKAALRGQDLIQSIERDLRSLKSLMDDARGAFDGECEKEMRKLRRRLCRIQNAVEDWHEDAADCVTVGDPTVQFGGK